MHQGPQGQDSQHQDGNCRVKNETEAKALWAYLKQYDAEGKTR